MNQLQIAIIGLVVGVIIIIIAYHFYQESRFKNSIDKNFNNPSDDALKEDHGVIFENQMEQIETKKTTPINNRDVANSSDLAANLKQGEIAFDESIAIQNDNAVSLEVDDERFADFDSIEFPFAYAINDKYQHVIDVFFEKATKVKMFPDLSQFASKNVQYYILDSKLGWTVFERNRKYSAQGIKVIIDLVDSEGCIYPLQLTNMFNELNKFAGHHNALIRQKDSELEIRRIQQQLKNLSHALLELELFVVNKDELAYHELAKYFVGHGFIENKGFFEFKTENQVVFYIADENGGKLNPNGTYRIFSINSKLHHQPQPMNAVMKIFDVIEDYMQFFESRLLTSNKLVMSEREFNALERQVNNYINTCKRFNIELGSELILRVYP